MLRSLSSRGGVRAPRRSISSFPSFKPVHGSLSSRGLVAFSHPLSFWVHLQRILLLLLLFRCPPHRCALSGADQSFCAGLQGTERREICHLRCLRAPGRNLCFLLSGHSTVHRP